MKSKDWPYRSIGLPACPGEEFGGLRNSSTNGEPAAANYHAKNNFDQNETGSPQKTSCRLLLPRDGSRGLPHHP
jgi:hypothetical protein